MVERKRLGIIFKVNPNWMGGTYYILNIINSLNYLEDKKKPTIILLCSEIKDFEYAKEYTGYPYMEYTLFHKRLNKFQYILNKISNRLLGKYIIPIHNKIKKGELDVIYPITNINYLLTGPKNIGWIPDFQEKHLSELFSQAAIKARDRTNSALRDSGIKIVLSSEDAKNDYLTYFNASENKTSVLRFTSKIPKIDQDWEKISNKYKVVENQYFFCGNQFWIHKNHMVLFEAVKIIKDKGYNPILLCTGNPKDHRAIDHFEKLQKFIEDNNLQSNIQILGLINRNEQLALMANCRCIIQPSLFEGWNTSVEEAKALNKMLIVSDLDVHKEQVNRNGVFFKRDSPEDLAEKMMILMNNNIEPESFDYAQTIKESAETFIKIMQEDSV